MEKAACPFMSQKPQRIPMNLSVDGIQKWMFQLEEYMMLNDRTRDKKQRLHLFYSTQIMIARMYRARLVDSHGSVPMFLPYLKA